MTEGSFGSRRGAGRRSAAAGAVLFLAAVSPLFAASLTPYYTVTLSGSNAVVTKVSSGTMVNSSADHQSAIQYAIDNLPAGRTTKSKVLITGDFLSDDTIYIPSYTCIELAGSITLKPNVNKQLVAQKNSTAGDTQIEMIGGTYDGNKYNEYYDPTGSNSPGFYCILFKKVSNSDFSGVTAQNCGSDAFILDENCSSNRLSNMLGRHAGIPETGYSNGNGLGDRGDHNTWTDCITDDTYSDGWVIKCRNSTFTRCKAMNGATGAGFGLFGDRLIENNNFFDCEVTGFNGRGVSLRKPTNKGNDPIRNNYFQIYVHDGGVRSSDSDQIGFQLWSSVAPVVAGDPEMITGNVMDLLVCNNYQYGFYIRDGYVSHTTGTIVVFDNTIDAQIEGHDNNLTFLVPYVSQAIIYTNGVQNTVNIRKIASSDQATSWAAQKYYELFSNQAPVFASSVFTKPNATAGIAYSDSIADQVSNPEGAALTFSKVSGPAWLTVSTNGALQGTAGSGDVGTNTFAVRVENGQGGSNDASMQIVVVYAQPVITVAFQKTLATTNYQSALALNFSVNGSGVVTLDASSTGDAAAQTAVNAWDGPVGTVQDANIFNTSFSITLTASVSGGSDTISFSPNGGGGLGVHGQSSSRIDRPGVETLNATVAITNAKINIETIQWVNRANANVGLLLTGPGASLTNILNAAAGSWDVSAADLQIGNGESFRFGNASSTNAANGYTLAGFTFGLISTGTPNTYDGWTSGYGLTGGAANSNADPDGDGANNLYEYALGGNPTNGTDAAAIQPVARLTAGNGTNWLEYVYNRRHDAAARGLTYALERRDDLTSGSWSNIGTSAETGYGLKNAEFDSVTNLIPTAGKTKDFIRLKITGN